MASIYRFSFEHDIIPGGVTILTGSIWSGQGRFGAMTNALTATTRTGSIYSAINVAVPSGSAGIRTSFYTKASDNMVFPTKLADAGPYSFRLLSESTAEILFNNVSAITQDVTIVEDNRWNLVRFSTDFNGSNSTASLEFNGIRVDVSKPDATVGVSSINLYGLSGRLSCIDDVGINDSTGTIPADSGMPNSIRGFVGGLIEDGDIQNWQQNVASLFPLNYNHEAQGNILYVPSADKIITCNKSSSIYAVDEHTFTVVDAQSFVTESTFSEVVAPFTIQKTVYNDSDGLVYFLGTNTGSHAARHFAYKTYDPITNTTSSVTVWTGGFDLTPPVYDQYANPAPVGYEYRFRDVIAATYCPLNSKIYCLVTVYNPYYPHPSSENPSVQTDSVENKSWIQMLVIDTKNNTIDLSYKYFGSWTHIRATGGGGAVPNYITPPASMIWNQYDQTLFAWCPKFSGEEYSAVQFRSIEPTSLVIKKQKAPLMLDVSGLYASNPDVTADMVYSDINNSVYVSLWTGVYASSNVYSIDMATKTGSIVFPRSIGTAIKRVEYSPARNAIFCLGEVESFMFDPIKATTVQSAYREYGITSSQWLTLAESGSLLSGSIIETVPLFNVNDSVYSPKNSTIISVTDKKVYNLKGSMESSVVNALMSPDSLKAGATASGDICTLKIAKPTGSFTSQYQYEGFNIRVDNASSLATASLLIGVRENNTDIALGTPIITWANSTGSHVRSVFSVKNQGTTKWSASQFEQVQFYMEASD